MKLKALLVLLFIIPCLNSQEDSLNAVKLGHWYKPGLPATYVPNIYNDVWGIHWKGKDYAIIGSTLGTHIIDVTDPSNAFEVDFVPGVYNLPIHRDIKSYKNYLYVVTDAGFSTFQIIDYSYLPDSVHLVYNHDSLIISSHNIFIDSATATLYAASVRSGNYPGSYNYFVLSLANPEVPVLISKDNVLLPESVHDFYVRNDTIFANDGNSGLFIMKKNGNNISVLKQLSGYPDNGYNHSGWWSEDGKYYVFADETYGKRIKILKTEDFNNLEIISLFGFGTNQSVPHNLIWVDTLVYISYYFDGLQVYNVKDPYHPVRIAYYDECVTTVNDASYAGAWGVYPLTKTKILISDMMDGLFIIDISEAFKQDVSPDTANYPDIQIESNITDNNLRLNIPDGYENLQWWVYSSGGKLISEGKHSLNKQRTKLDLNINTYLSQGMYFLLLHADSQVKSFKWFKY
ncbi:MAG: hypothetical protein KatS3mg034_1672 [Vicingaceae bacterium]|nr:MAG: hypothetical protein KatS3mg034_1672 [Vicingaceae bacterium]